MAITAQQAIDSYRANAVSSTLDEIYTEITKKAKVKLSTIVEIDPDLYNQVKNQLELDGFRINEEPRNDGKTKISWKHLLIQTPQAPMVDPDGGGNGQIPKK